MQNKFLTRSICFWSFGLTLLLILPNIANAHVIYPYEVVFQTPTWQSIKKQYSVSLAQDAEKMPIQKENVESPVSQEEAPPQPANPQELRDAIKQTTELLRDIQRLKKLAVRNKVTGIEELSVIQAQIIEFQNRLKAAKVSTGREILEDFWQENFWEQITPLRLKIELPNELREIAKRLKEADRLIASPAMQKAFVGLGVNLDAVKNKITEIRAAYENAKSLYDANNLEEIDEAMQIIRENGNHPGNITSMMFGIRETWNRLRQIRDEELRNAIKEALQPIIEAINEGDYQEAQFLQNEIGQELDRIINKALEAGLRGNKRNDLLNRLNKLENLLEEKSGQQGAAKEEPSRMGP